MNVDCEAVEVEGEARRRGVRAKGMPMCREQAESEAPPCRYQ